MTLTAGTRLGSSEILAPLGGGIGDFYVRKLLKRPNAEPGRVGFPKSNLR